MQYETPELVVLGQAAALVQGGPPGMGDSNGSPFERLDGDTAVGLDD